MVALADWRITLTFLHLEKLSGPPGSNPEGPFSLAALMAVFISQDASSRLWHFLVCCPLAQSVVNENLKPDPCPRATATYGSINSAADWLVKLFYLVLSGWKFTNYNDWAKFRGILLRDWPGYMAWNYQSEKSKNLMSFLYTSMIYCVLQPMALKSWSLSCVMVGYSGRVPIYPSQSKGKHSKESRTVTRVSYILWHPLVLLTGVKTHRTIYNFGNQSVWV